VRGYTYVELIVAAALISGLILVVYGATVALSQQRMELTAYVSDLEQTTGIVDRMARVIRESPGVVAKSPDGRVRTAAGSLVLQRAGGGVRAFTLAQSRVGTRLRLLEYGAGGDPISDTDWGPVGGLRFRYNDPRPGAVTLVTFEVLLPRRSPDAPPAPLATRARLLAGGRG
jgi:hypothetical protein